MTSVQSCPRCRIPLHQGQARAAPLWGCGVCGGVWLDAECSRRVTEALHSDVLALADAAAQHASAVVDPRQGGLACPVCGGPLSRRLEPHSHIELDDCPKQHGTWFDRDELRGVAVTLAARRAYGGPTGGKVAPAAAAAAVATAVAGGIVAAQHSGVRRQLEQSASGAGELALDVAETGVELAADVASSGAADAALDVAGAVTSSGIGEAVLEGAGTAFELGFSIIGGLLEGLGS